MSLHLFELSAPPASTFVLAPPRAHLHSRSRQCPGSLRLRTSWARVAFAARSLLRLSQVQKDEDFALAFIMTFREIRKIASHLRIFDIGSMDTPGCVAFDKLLKGI